jgi:very-short-patch-repair endonuclease
LPGYRFHQTRRPYQLWVKPAAGPPRLPVEHSALLAAERDHNIRGGIGLLAACVQQQLTTAQRFGQAIPQIRKLRHGKTFRLVLQDIAGGAQSFAELDVSRLCDQHRLTRPNRQVVRFDKQGKRRYLDCVWILSDGRVVVLEVDGSFHAEVNAWWTDMKRERAVVVQGDTVLRCSSIELRLEPVDIMSDLRKIGVPTVERRQEAS